MSRYDYSRPVGAFGILEVEPGTPEALTCGTCGRMWVEDITPAGRCPWEHLHEEWQFTLSETEVACGVTEEDAKREAARALFTSDREHVVLDPRISPALAGAAARYAMGGPVEFLWLNHAQMPVYARR